MSRFVDVLRPLERGFIENDWPTLPCPECERPTLRPEAKDSLRVSWSIRSKRRKRDWDFDPFEHMFGTFHAVLVCRLATDCGESVTLTGDVELDHVAAEDG